MHLRQGRAEGPTPPNDWGGPASVPWRGKKKEKKEKRKIKRKENKKGKMGYRKNPTEWNNKHIEKWKGEWLEYLS